MTFAIALTAAAAFLSAVAIVILVILVAGIRSDDRAPRTRTEQATRLLLGVGIRAPASPSHPESDLP